MKKYKNVLQIAGYVIVGIILGAWLFSVDLSEKQHTENSGPIKAEQIWTCSMHPQIQLDEPGQCPICGMDLIPLDGFGEDEHGDLVLNETSMRLAGVEVSRVFKTSPRRMIELSGTLISDKSRSRSQSFHFSGRIEHLNISTEGEIIRQGQKIGEIYSPDLIVAQKELIEASKRKNEFPQLYNAVKQKIAEWKIPQATIREIEQKVKLLNGFPFLLNTVASFPGSIFLKVIILNGGKSCCR